MIEAEVHGKGSKGRSTLSELGRQLGLTARYAVEGVTAIPNMIGDALGLRSSEAVSGALTSAGLPSPEGATERVVGDVTRAMAGAGGIQALGQGLAGAAGPVAQGVGETLAAAPGMQAVSAATGSGASGIVREEGGGTGAQIAAGIAGAAAPSILKAGAEAALRGAVRGGEQGRAEMAGRIGTFEDAGASPSAGQASGNRVVQASESALSKTPGSAGVMAKAAERQAQEMGARVDKIADEVFPKASAAKAGIQISKGVEKFVGRFKAQQGNLYKALDDQIPGESRVDISNTRAALEQMNADIPGAPSLSEWFKNAKIKGLEAALKSDTEGTAGALSTLPPWEKQRLMALPQVQREAELASMVDGKLPYEALKKLRTLVGNEISNTSLTSDIPRSKWKAFYASLSQDMEQVAKDTGPNAERAFRRANAFTSAGHSRIDTFLDKVSGKDSVEKIFTAAVNPSELKEGASTINAVMRSLQTEERRAVSAALIKRMGVANPGNQNDLGEVFSSQTFLTNWNKISPDAKRVLFAGSKGNDLRQNLDKIAEAANTIKQGSKVFANPSGTAPAAANIGGATALAVAAGTGNLGLAGALLGGAASANLSARLLTHQPFVKWLAQTTRISGGALPAQLNVLTQMVQREQDPEVKGDLEAYFTTLSEQLGQQQKQPDRPLRR